MDSVTSVKSTFVSMCESTHYRKKIIKQNKKREKPSGARKEHSDDKSNCCTAYCVAYMARLKTLRKSSISRNASVNDIPLKSKAS